MSRWLGVVACMASAALPAFALREDRGPGALPAAAAAQPQPQALAAARVRSAAQTRAAELAEQAGVEVAWHERLATPLSVRAADLGRRQAFSGGKGLALRGGGAYGEDAVAVLDNLSPLFGIGDAGGEFAVKKVSADRLGNHHVRFTQKHNGLRVVGGELIVHFNPGGVAYEVNGQYIPDIAVAVTPTVMAAAAIAAAQGDLAAKGLPQGELPARPELVVFARSCEPRLAYELTLLHRSGAAVTGRWRYWIDARQGTVLSYYNDVKRIDPPSLDGEPAEVTGNLLPREGGALKAVTGWRENTDPFTYYLVNLDAKWVIMNAAVSGYPDANTFAYRQTSDWGTSDTAESSAAYNVDVIQRYYQEVHGLDSYDGEGSPAISYVHETQYGLPMANAYWDGTAMHIGDGDGKTADNLAVLDVFTHEYTHAVTEHSANLTYAYESGALNESFSDIFGVCVEFAAQEDDRTNYPAANAGKADWLMGEDCWLGSTALRDVRNPANTATVGAGNEQPTRYKGTYWYSGSGDNGGVHQNSGVQNFFFYLLCEGGTGTNDAAAYGYDVKGIGITNAQLIAYRALTEYCTEDTDYFGAKEAWISAARDIDIASVRSVKQAWNAVLGLAPYPPFQIYSLGTLPAGRVGTTYDFTLRAGNGEAPYVWQAEPDVFTPAGLTFEANGRISGLPEAAGQLSFTAIVTDAAGEAITNQFSLTILPAFSVPFVETFETLTGQMSEGWSQEYVTKTLVWSYANGNGSTVRNPAAARSGTNNACLRALAYEAPAYVTRLVTPRLVFAPGARYPQLSFWHYMAKQSVFQDELRVYYKTAHAGEWQLLQTFTQSVNLWTRRTLALPEPSETYYIAFEGTAKYGYGVHIDDVEVYDAYVPLDITAPSVLPDAVLKEPYSFTLAAVGGAGTNTFALLSGELPKGLELSTNGVISGTATNLGSSAFTVLLTDGAGETATAEFTLTVGLPRVVLFAEPFEYGGAMPAGWTQAYVTNQLSWACREGGGDGVSVHLPTNAYQGFNNAVLWSNNASNNMTRFVTPAINLGAAPTKLRLDFWHCMTAFEGRQDELRVYYRTSASGAWNALATYTDNVTEWTRRTLLLPNTPASAFYLAFEGNARFGHGVCIDDIRITDESLEPVFMTVSLPEATVGYAYSKTLEALGGVAPYVWELVSGTLPAGLTFNADGVLSGTPEVPANVTLVVRVTDQDGYASTNSLALKVSNLPKLPYVQDFESRAQLPTGWSQEYVSGSRNWQFRNGTFSGGIPSAAHSGTNSAVLYLLNTTGAKTKLIMPALDLGVGMTNARLSFWLCMAKYTAQDELRVFYKTNLTDTAWTEFAYFKNSLTSWTNVVLDLPNPSPTYVIAFEGYAKYGYGVCIDDVAVTGDYAASGYDQWKAAAFGADAGNDLISGSEADPDNDGVENWREYAMGLDPLTPDAEGLPTGGVTAGYLTLSYRESQSASDVLFQVEACTDLLLQDWTTNGVSEILRGDSNLWWQVTTRHDVPVTNAPQRFLRLKLTWPAP